MLTGSASDATSRAAFRPIQECWSKRQAQPFLSTIKCSMKLLPMRLLRIPEPFDHPDFVYEPKIDGFRALAQVPGHRCELISRNGHVFKSWPQLSEEIAHAVRASDVVLDGEICCLRPDGRSDFKSLLFRREWPYFYAFDLLALNGRDLRSLPLLERKRRLFAIMPRIESRVLYLDHVHERGVDLYSVEESNSRERLSATVCASSRPTASCPQSLILRAPGDHVEAAHVRACSARVDRSAHPAASDNAAARCRRTASVWPLARRR